MVIPWVGHPAGRFHQALRAYVEGEIRQVHHGRRQQADGRTDGARSCNWPYVEGLRMDEAMHPLALLARGSLRRSPAQPERRAAAPGGAVEAYGFKHVKSIVKITFTEKQPLNTWQEQAPSEYGFYANVNPQVDHPRWSQATERRIGEFLRRKTLMFNGYGSGRVAVRRAWICGETTDLARSSRSVFLLSSDRPPGSSGRSSPAT